MRIPSTAIGNEVRWTGESLGDAQPSLADPSWGYYPGQSKRAEVRGYEALEEQQEHACLSLLCIISAPSHVMAASQHLTTTARPGLPAITPLIRKVMPTCPPSEPHLCFRQAAFPKRVIMCVRHVQFRSMLAGAVISTIFSIIVHKLNLTTGIVPSLNIAAGLLGFVFLRGWVYLLRLMGIKAHEFTPQASYPRLQRLAGLDC